MIRSLFPQAEAQLILKTPLFPTVQVDKLFWPLNTDGIYLVKTTYRLVIMRLIDSSHLREECNRMMIWKLKVPPTVKIFLCHSCKGCLPTRLQLQSRGVPCPNSCVVCDREMEHMWHLNYVYLPTECGVLVQTTTLAAYPSLLAKC